MRYFAVSIMICICTLSASISYDQSPPVSITEIYKYYPGIFPPVGVKYPPQNITKLLPKECCLDFKTFEKVKSYYNEAAIDTFLFWLDRIDAGLTSEFYWITLVLWRQEFLLWLEEYIDYWYNTKGGIYPISPPALPSAT